MKPILVLSFFTTLALAGFTPSVRIDHGYNCDYAAIAVGPPCGQSQPLYVVFENDNESSSVCFQKSTDAGTTWLAENQVVCQGEDPDVTTDSHGNVYVVCDGAGHVYCSLSTDGGTTWSAQSQVDDSQSRAHAVGARVTTDTAGNLLCAWIDGRAGYEHIWSSVSTDQGTTWSPNLRVDDDTVSGDCVNPDVFVQPGTNHYLVAASGPYICSPGYASYHTYLYRSTDMGHTFSPAFQLDSLYFGYEPHVVADAQYVICDYTGSTTGNNLTQARTLYTARDTWGPCRSITDKQHDSYYCSKLALTADGEVHMALVADYPEDHYYLCYSLSSDHGASWSSLVHIDSDTTGVKDCPDIATDSAGRVYVVWEDSRGTHGEIWFSTNIPAGIAENSTSALPSVRLKVEPSVFSRATTIHISRSSLLPPHLSLFVFDASGRLVRSFAAPSSVVSRPYLLTWNGCDEAGRRCAPGAYLVRAGSELSKVVLLPTE